MPRNEADRRTRNVAIDIAQESLRQLRLVMHGETVRHHADIARVTRLIQQLDELRLK